MKLLLDDKVTASSRKISFRGTKAVLVTGLKGDLKQQSIVLLILFINV